MDTPATVLPGGEMLSSLIGIIYNIRNPTILDVCKFTNNLILNTHQYDSDDFYVNKIYRVMSKTIPTFKQNVVMSNKELLKMMKITECPIDLMIEHYDMSFLLTYPDQMKIRNLLCYRCIWDPEKIGYHVYNYLIYLALFMRYIRKSVSFIRFDEDYRHDLKLYSFLTIKKSLKIIEQDSLGSRYKSRIKSECKLINKYNFPYLALSYRLYYDYLDYYLFYLICLLYPHDTAMILINNLLQI